MMCSLLYNVTARKNKSKQKDEFENNCFLCISEHGHSSIFNNIDSLLRHVRKVHYDHPASKRYKLAIKHLQFVTHFVSPKNGEKK